MRFATVKAFRSIECGLITQVARTPTVVAAVSAADSNGSFVAAAACSVYPNLLAAASALGVPAANILAKRTSVAALCERRALASAVLSGVNFSHPTCPPWDGLAVGSLPPQSYCVLQLRRVERVTLAEIARLITAAEPAHALFGGAVRK